MVKRKAIKSFGSKKEKRDKKSKKNKMKKSRDARKEKQMHFNYERLGSDDEIQEHEDLMKFGTYSMFIYA